VDLLTYVGHFLDVNNFRGRERKLRWVKDEFTRRKKSIKNSEEEM
jgi:hypothetical protein